MVALDIGSYSIKFVVGQQIGGRIKVTAAFEEVLPDGVYENGRILDREVLQAAVMAGLKKNRIHIKDVSLTLESSEIIKREMIVPKVDAADLTDLVAFEVAQYLPIDIDAYVIQHKRIETVVDGEVEKLKVLLGAVPKEIVEAHFELVKGCGLTPQYMDIHSNSLEKITALMFAERSPETLGTTAFIDFGHKMIDVGVYENGRYRFNRILRLGGYEIDRAVERHRGGNIGEIKRALKPFEETEGDEIDRFIADDVKAYLEECLVEIDKVFKYHVSRSADSKIDRIVLLGGCSNIQGFLAYAKAHFLIETLTVDQVSILELSNKATFSALNQYLNAVGALIRK